ncbi:hypothetical protein HYV82_02235 [Candidatus Woesearchaeota archaeon]|nr:hypothetical protein [Candidatus Woesearchaeota archaeon]
MIMMVTTMHGYSTQEPDRYWPGRISHVAQMMAAVADSDRLKTLDALVDESLSFIDLRRRVGDARPSGFIPSSTLFHYLTYLELSGLVERKEPEQQHSPHNEYQEKSYYEITELGRVVIDYMRRVERAMRGPETRRLIKVHMASKPNDVDEEGMAKWKRSLDFITGIFGEETA